MNKASEPVEDFFYKAAKALHINGSTPYTRRRLNDAYGFLEVKYPHDAISRALEIDAEVIKELQSLNMMGANHG